MSKPKVNARTIALDALLRVDQDGAFLDKVLPAAFERLQPSPEDKGLAMELATGVLRRRRWLDQAIAQHTKLNKLDPIVLQILRLGAYQLICLDRIPAHAAVSTSVDIAKHRRRFAAGLVNAVLRRLSEAPKPDVVADEVYASMPDWLGAELRSALQTQSLPADREVFAQKMPIDLPALFRSFADAAHPTLRVLENRMHRAELLQLLETRGVRASACEASPVGVEIDRAGDVSDLPGFGRNFIAQDEAAQLVCELARNEQGPTLDGCAAPGGKTIALASMGHTPLTAVDVHENRVGLLQRGLAAADISATVLRASMEEPPFPAASFTTVVIDSPCTGAGTLRRHPELRWTLKQQDVSRLTTLQTSILEHSAALVKPGGCLIYAVCSFIRAEGEEQIASFLTKHPEFKLEAWLTTTPRLHTMDGFFAAKLRK